MSTVHVVINKSFKGLTFSVENSQALESTYVLLLKILEKSLNLSCGVLGKADSNEKRSNNCCLHLWI